MKKIHILSGAILALVALTAVQARAVDVTSVGLKAGFSLADMQGNDWGKEFKARSGFAVGVFLTLDLAEGLSVQPEMLFVQKGSKAEEGDVTIAVRLSYFEIPVLLKYAFPLGRESNIHLFGGPALGLKFDSRLRLKIGDSDVTQQFNEAKSFDIGLAVGGGFSLPVGGKALTFDVRYTLGLTNCCESLGADYDVKNNAILFLVGITL